MAKNVKRCKRLEESIGIDEQYKGKEEGRLRFPGKEDAI